MCAIETENMSEEVELSVPLETVCYIIQKGHDLQGKTASSLFDDESGETDNPEAEILEDRATDPVALEIASVISDLPEDAQVDLVALMWLGRDEDEWSDLRTLAWQERNQSTAAYLTGTPLFADYIEAGLNALGFDCRAWNAENL